MLGGCTCRFSLWSQETGLARPGSMRPFSLVWFSRLLLRVAEQLCRNLRASASPWLKNTSRGMQKIAASLALAVLVAAWYPLGTALAYLLYSVATLYLYLSAYLVLWFLEELGALEVILDPGLWEWLLYLTRGFWDPLE